MSQTRLWQLTWRLDGSRSTHAAANPADYYSDCLGELGAACVWVDEPDDPGEQSAGLQYHPGDLPNWRRPTLHALVAGDTACNQLMLGVTTCFPELGAPEVCNPDLETDQQRSGLPRRIDFGRLRLYTNRESFSPGEGRLCIPAGLAFGTGTHPTTAMALRWCGEAQLRGVRLLDYGCGSGILGLAALTLGAHSAVAVDHDPQALEATNVNAACNSLVERIRVQAPEMFAADLEAESGVAYSVIFANILLKPLVDLSGLLTTCLAPDGKLLLTGILTEQRDTLLAAYRHHLGARMRLESSEQMQQDGWSLVVITKK